MNNDELTSWLNKLPNWIRYAAKLLIEKEQISIEDINTISDICIHKSNIAEISLNADMILKSSPTNLKMHIDQISEIKGVNRLNPRHPLVFGDENLSVVYGPNGAGKSSYIRLLKNACNTRKKEKILGNVYNEINTAPSAKIKFSLNDNPVEKEWASYTSIPELHLVDIYDTDYSDLFLREPANVSYEPYILVFFSKLIGVIDAVHKHISEIITSLKSTLPIIPLQYQNTKSYNWFNSLSAQTSDVDFVCNYTIEDERELNIITSRLSEQNPLEKANKIKSYKTQIDFIEQKLKKYDRAFSKEMSDKIQTMYEDCNVKRAASEAAAVARKSQTVLDGLGTDAWKELWSAAKKFSEINAYQTQKFPFTGNGARCVLCHQLLDDEAKKRFLTFDDYVKGETERNYQESLQKLNNEIQNLPIIDNIETWKTYLLSASISDEQLTKRIIDLQKVYGDKRQCLLDRKKIQSNENISDVYSSLDTIKMSYEEQIKQLENDAKQLNRTDLLLQKNELNAKKWITENKIAIQKEVVRLQDISKLEKYLNETNTRPITMKKSDLSTSLITEEFVNRFNEELKLLGAKVAVSFVKYQVRKDLISHKIVLKGAKQDVLLDDVLSEGEYRIIALAAFLADVKGRKGSLPFIFDDPITSMDQNYEEAVAQRLIQLSAERQVIVFTHRLSFMTLLQPRGVSSNTICISNENWGAGEPSQIPINVDKPDKTLNRMINEMPSLKRIYEEQGSSAYYYPCKAICSDFRILIERTVELKLLGDVVQRFRRAVNTQGKLINVAKVNSSDCKLFDDFMTKYSKFEHSQTQELPISMPTPDELLTDMNNLKSWYLEFDKRQILK